jgi:hypothetical protein
MPNGPVEIWQEASRGAVAVTTALDLAAVLADWPFGPGRFWLVTGQRCELFSPGGGQFLLVRISERRDLGSMAPEPRTLRYVREIAGFDGSGQFLRAGLGL